MLRPCPDSTSILIIAVERQYQSRPSFRSHDVSRTRIFLADWSFEFFDLTRFRGVRSTRVVVDLQRLFRFAHAICPISR
jgi:hypothetical protein